MNDECAGVPWQSTERALRLLHTSGRALYRNDGDFCRAAVPLFQRLQALLGIGPMRLYLTDATGGEHIEVATTHAAERPAYCRDPGCRACLETEPGCADAARRGLAPARRTLLPIRAGHERLGAIEACHPGNGRPDASVLSFLRLLADQLAMPIYLRVRRPAHAIPPLQRHRHTTGTPQTTPLTPREAEILGLIGLGLSNKMIARRLDIAEGTVKVHVKHLLEKLALRSRVEAAVWATQSGMSQMNGADS